MEGIAAVPIDDGLQSIGSYSGNDRPDFIPSHANKDIAEGTLKYFENKEEVSE